MSELTGSNPQTEPGLLDGVKDTAESWYDTAKAVGTGNSGVTEALSTDSHDETAVKNIRNMGNMGMFGITAGFVIQGGLPALGLLAGGAAGAFIGAGIVNHFALDEKLLDFLGKPKIAKPGPEPATFGHEIAHSSPLAAALGGLIAGVVVGALCAAAAVAIIGTGGIAAAPILAAVAIGGAAGLGGGFAGALVSGFFSKSATVTGKIERGSPDVFFENKAVARVTDIVSCSKHSTPPQIAEGSNTISVNGLPLARIGHKTTCSATIQQGCKTIFADSTTGSYLPMDSELSAREQAIVSTAEVVATLGVARLLSKLGLRCGDPVNPADGSFFDSRTDFEYPSILPLRLTRTYSGKDPVESVLGGRWICNWSQRLVYITNEPTANLEDGEGEVLQFPLGKVPEFNSRNLKAAHYHLRGTRQQALLFDSRSQQTLVFETTETNPDVGRLTSIQDRNNNRIDFIYEGNNLSRVEHSDGTTFYITTTVQGFIETIASEESGRLQPIVQYSYTPAGELSSVHGKFSGEFHYTYTKEGWLNHWHDSGTTRADLEYDTEGRVIATRMPDGMYNDHYAYFPEEKKTQYFDATGGCATFWFNDNNQLIREQDPLGNITTHEISSLDRKLSTTDALGRVTAFEYDIFGHLTGQTDWTGRSTSLAYNKQGQLIKIDYPDGTPAAWKYDDRGNLVSATGPDGLTTHFSYDEQGKLLYEIGPDGSTSRLEYNHHGRLVALHNALGQTTGFDLDRWGRLLNSTDPAGHSTRYEYDLSPDNQREDLSRIIHPDGGEERFAYDQEGMLATHIAQEGQTTRYQHGSNDLLRSVIDPRGHGTQLEYDGAARLKRITNAAGQTWNYTYNLAGQLAMETDWAGRQTSYIRDAIGRVLTKRLPDGIEQHLSWDELDRIIAVETARQRITYEYDNADRLTRAATFTRNSPGPESELQFSYDDKGRLTNEIQNGIAIEYKYDTIGRCISRTSPTGETTFSYDMLGQFTGTTSNGHALEFTRDSRGLETQRSYRSDESLSQSPVPDPQSLNAFSLNQNYDPCGRLTSQSAGQKTAYPTPAHEKLAEISRKYSWDKSGRLVGLKDNKRGTSSYQYDPRDQVKSVQRQAKRSNSLSNERYDYDALMNLAQSDGQAHRYEGDCITRIGNTSYRHDARGRVIEKTAVKNGFRPKTWRYLWDDFDRLVETHTPDGSLWRYTYDAFGRRIKKECVKAGEFRKTSSTMYIWQGATVAEEYTTTGDDTESTRWHFEPGTFNPFAKEVNGSFYPIVTDHLGTPKEMFDSNGECLWQADHSLWGKTSVVWQRMRKQTNGSGNETQADSPWPAVECKLRFQNQWEDEETGLYYNLNRYYDPESGQYLSQDPIGLEGGLRTHGYVHDPMQWVDPLGLCKNSKSGTPKYTFRGDTRTPAEIFSNGFQPRGTNTDLLKYARNNEPSVFVGTSTSPKTAGGFAGEGGHVYTVRPGSSAVDVNASLGKMSPFPHETEIVSPGGISPSDIMGARQVGPNGLTGPFIKNPNYTPN